MWNSLGHFGASMNKKDREEMEQGDYDIWAKQHSNFRKSVVILLFQVLPTKQSANETLQWNRSVQKKN